MVLKMKKLKQILRLIRLPSYKAMQQRAQNDEVVKKQLINDKMSDAMQDFDEIENTMMHGLKR